MRKIQSEILEKLKNKYGIESLRKVVQLYGLGIPEKYWFTKPTDTEKLVINDFIELMKRESNLIIITTDVEQGNKFLADVLKTLGNIKNSRYLDFVTVANEMVDKFGQLNMNLVNDLAVEDVIAISNIKAYGNLYLTRIYPVFASFIDSMFNSVLDKKILLVLEYKGDINEIDKSFGIEFVDTMNSIFAFYQLAVSDEKN